MRWCELAAGATLAGAWTVCTFIGPGFAAIYWDRYLRASAASSAASAKQWSSAVGTQHAPVFSLDEPLCDVMQRQLELALAWDPNFARARLRLAANYVARFESVQLQSENAMSLPQIRDAAASSVFDSDQERREWLQRAFGANLNLLRQADALAHHALELSPLQGEGYVLLAATCFLNGRGHDSVAELFSQALRVRPHDGDILFEIGRQELTAGHLEAGLEYWRKCFSDHGPHQIKIIYLLAGRIPAEMFISSFHPDWWTLREVWTRYRDLGQRDDLEHLLTYATAEAQQEARSDSDLRPKRIWYFLSKMYDELDKPDEAFACLQRAHASNPRDFNVRLALANAMLSQRRYAEAETHFRWCLARRPEMKQLGAALLTIAKHRLAERELSEFASQTIPRTAVK
jgi:tetratricopeptide (TPR) repeat protein